MWRIIWQIVKISVSCKIFVLTSTYLLSNILKKLLSITDIISQNCLTSHLYPLSVNVIQTVTQSVQYSSAQQLIYCELLYRQRREKNWVSLLSLTFVHAHQTHSVHTEPCEAQHNYAPHDVVSVNDGPHIHRRSHNIIVLNVVLQLPTVFGTVTRCTGL
jgi:hypothetical protein